MTLQITPRDASTLPFDFSSVLPERLRGESLAAIERWPIRQGNQRMVLAEGFAVRGNCDDARLDLAGDFAHVHGIGLRQSTGEIVVQGNVGREAGAEMTGGTLRIDGNAAAGLGTQMHEGLIQVRGNAGDGAGGSYPGSARGMTGGTILIHGRAGAEVGRSMRRGLIAVGQACGPRAGLGMIAGTLLLGGPVAAHLGLGMHRGTLILLDSSPVTLLPTFRWACTFHPPALALVAQELRRHDFPLPARVHRERFALYHGDLVATGKGEVWLRQPRDCE